MCVICNKLCDSQAEVWNVYIKIVMRKIVIIFLSVSLNMCFRCSKEPSHRDGSFEYPQHMFWLRNNENNFQLRSLIWGLVECMLKI